MKDIVVIVLSAILLLLILGLIFKPDFRNDILNASSENGAEIKGFKITGAIFWVIYALTAIGTIYLAIQKSTACSDINDASVSAPIFKTNGSNEWLALDLKAEKPTKIIYGCIGNTKSIDHTDKNQVSLNLGVNKDFDVVSTKSGYNFGAINLQTLNDLHLSNDFNIEAYLEISYDLQLSPFRSIRNDNIIYSWAEYNNLPFKIEPRWNDKSQLHTVIESINPEVDLGLKPISFNNKWAKVLYRGGKVYIVRLRSRDLSPNNDLPEHANYQIIVFSGKILPVPMN